MLQKCVGGRGSGPCMLGELTAFLRPSRPNGFQRGRFAAGGEMGKGCGKKGIRREVKGEVGGKDRRRR